MAEPKHFCVKTVNDLDKVYALLRKKYPVQEIDVCYNWNTKEYNVRVTDKPYIADPEVPLDLNVEVVYGDSVTGDTPLLLKDPNTGNIFVRTISSLGDTENENKNGNGTNDINWNDYPHFKWYDTTVRLEKSFMECPYEVWSDLGWTKIERVIRHKTDKRIYRVFTKTGIVDVTEDHSLVGAYYDYITPHDVQIGQALLQSFPSASVLETGICQKFRQGFNNDRTVFDNKLEAMCALLEYTRRGKTVTIGCINNVYTLDVCSNIEIGTDSTNSSNSSNSTNSSNNLVYKIVELSRTGDNFVYDLETACGRFGAGVGNLVVKNTDSCFLRFKYNRDDFERNRIDTFNLATLCGNKLTDEVFKRPPIELEFEKVFQPFVLLTKKRYIAQKYENTKNPFQLKGIDAKGIALTRRDYCKMVKNCYKEIIDTIMWTGPQNKWTGPQNKWTGPQNKWAGPQNSKDLDITVTDSQDSVLKSIDVFKRYIQKIDQYDIPIDDLVVSAMLAKSYKTKPVHVQLAERLKERKEEVQIGDRIPYIYIEDNAIPKRQKSELGEDPKYAEKHGLRFNRWCYLEQLAKPILGFYKIVLKDDTELLDTVINYVNTHIVRYGGKALKPSDFKIED